MEKDSFFGTDSPRTEEKYSDDDQESLGSSRSRSASESSVTSVSSQSSAVSDVSTISNASSKFSKASSKASKASSATLGDTASLLNPSDQKGSTASLLDHSEESTLDTGRSVESNSEASSRVKSPEVRELAAGDTGDKSIPTEEVKGVSDVVISNSMGRPKSSYPTRARKTSVASSTKSTNSVMSATARADVEKHRQRLLLSTGKSSKDINHLLETVLVLDQKQESIEQRGTDITQPRMPKARSNFRDNERHKEIQKENTRLLAELTRQGRRPQSAASVASGRSTRSMRSTTSAFSTASNASRYSTHFSPISRQTHSKINRDREAKRIDQENMAFLRRLNNVKASSEIRQSRQAVTAVPLRSRPKSLRPKVVNTWQDGW